MDTAPLHSLAKHLRASLPIELPVRVRLIDGSRRNPTLGQCTCSGNRYSITISRHLPLRFAIGVLIHEFCHALTWGLDGDEPTDDHGEMFREGRRHVFNSYMEWRNNGGSR